MVVVPVFQTPQPARGQFLERPLAITHARIVRVSGPVVEDGTLIIKGSRIEELGTDVRPSLLARVVDAKGKTVTPGLIDAFASLAMVPGRTRSSEVTSRAFDAFNRYAWDDVRDAWRNGVTTVFVPASGAGGVNGLGAVVRLTRGSGESAGSPLAPEAALCIDLRSGDTSTSRLKTFYDVRRAFRDALDYRRELEDYDEAVKEYEKKLKERTEAKAKEEAKKGDKKEEKPDPKKDDKPEDSPKTPPPPKDRPAPGGKDGAGPSASEIAADDERTPDPRNLAAPPAGSPDAAKDTEKEKKDEVKKPPQPKPDRGKDLLLKAIDRKLPVRVRAERSADILNALELAREFNLNVTIEGGTEAYLAASALAEAETPVVLGQAAVAVVNRPAERHRAAADNAARLEQAGVRWTIGSGVETAATRFVLFTAQTAAARMGANDGNDEDDDGDKGVGDNGDGGHGGDALRRVTWDAAGVLGLSRQIGHLAPGMEADLVIWNGDPYDPATRAERVYVAGKLVYQNDE